jgi:alpha-tubulin suppressor-like RCC1 family protein
MLLLHCIVLLSYVQGYGNTIDITDASEAKDVFLGTGVYATKISAGYANTCAILSNNKLLCWGLNQFGKLIDNKLNVSLLVVYW